MKKFVYIMIAITIATANKIFAQQTQIKINTQEVADIFGPVCLLYKNKQTKEVEFGNNRSVVTRKLMVGEVIELDHQSDGQNMRDVPIRLLTKDPVAIYSQRSYHSWDNSTIENWKKMALQSLNRNQTKPFNNFSKTNELKGYVLTSDTLAPVKAVISIIDEEGKELICNSDAGGRYSLKLPAGIYRYEVKSDDCLSYFDSLIISNEKMVTEKYILLPRVKIGNRIILKNIFFEFNKAKLLPDSYPELDALVFFLKENKSIEIELSGHTDNVGSVSYNQKLSEKRAKAVVDYLIQNGIVKDRLKYIGYGFAQPIVPNSNPDGSDNPDGRQKNRRTEFEVLRM